jgi:protein-S-isoprenylcysteine O-methyltransferase Ste14
MTSLARNGFGRQAFALAYAWAGVAIMWCFWVSFVVFLAEPHQVFAWWPLPTIDHGGTGRQPVVAALVDLMLVSLFGVQHSVMARPWFKQRVMSRIPLAMERSTYVHMANAALFSLILFWQPVAAEVWDIENGLARRTAWFIFGAGWIILFLGAWSFGMRDLLGIEQVRGWIDGRAPAHRLKTGLLYRWLRHPMYVGVLLGVWSTPRMSAGHLLLALALTAYVLIAMRYEERDLLERFGSRYSRWRSADSGTVPNP